MYNFASLLAEESVIQEVLQEGFSVTYPTENTIKVDYSSKEIFIDLDKLDWRTSLHCHQYCDNYEIINRLRRREGYNDIDYETAAGLFFLEQSISQNIKAEVYKQSKVTFTYYFIPRSVDVIDYQDLYDRLSLCKAIIEGYSFVEELGSHFTVHSPNNKVYAITSFCSCNEYRVKKKCLHHQLVSYLARNRDICNRVAKLTTLS